MDITQTATAFGVGSFVTLHIPSLKGAMKVAGKVSRILPNNFVEVRTQQHGFHSAHVTEVTVIR